MIVDVQDYVIFVDEKNRTSLAKVLSVREHNGAIQHYQGILEDNREQDSPDRVEINPESIIAVLGPDPVNGSVYNCQIEIFHLKKEYPGWGTGKVIYYRRMDQEYRKILGSAIRRTVKKIQKLGLDLHPFDTEIKEPKGKFQGQYKKVAGKKDGMPPIDVMTLRPLEFDELDRLLLHEIGHGIWFRRMPPDMQARWILAYHKAVDLMNVSKADIEETVLGFVKAGTACLTYRKSLESPHKEIWDLCLEFAQKKHSLSKKHLDTLIYSGYPVAEYFEVEEMTIPNMKLILTEYAQVSPEEFFAEAFALSQTGSELPKSLRKLMSVTLACAKDFVAE